MIGNFAQAYKGDTGPTVCIGGMRLESTPKVMDSKAYLGAMQMEHGGSKKSWADIVEEDGKLQSDGVLLDLDEAPSKGVKFASKAVTTEDNQIGSGSMYPMLEKLLDLVESWGDSGQEQGEASDGQRIEAIIASHPKYKRGKKKADQYPVTWEG
ncbi:hypothetical protein A4A49_16395 [Nicotiana attenuata]|uniref:Uncharacterized protein n=1 Tax=Nicotiana attenuata TaxID=49451 RepID=A0A1J6IRU7_NICAT|nr:hypothetical protein A4A49_16395 [Nicotiana attenuata]